MKKTYSKNKTPFKQNLSLVTAIILPLFISACSSSLERGEMLVAADEMKEGPGIFSGQNGGFYLAGGEKTVTASKPLSKMSADETSRIIDDRIEQLKRDQQELEELKRQLNSKL